ncbi:MAG: cytochrome c [Acidiferrobacterales bacterium]
MRTSMRYRQFPGLKLLIVLALSVAIDSSMAETGKKPDVNAVARGEGLYRSYCIRCHGVKGAGEKPISPYIRDPGYYEAPALDRSMHAWHHTDEALLKTILQGSPRTKRMPAMKGVITRKQAIDLVAYIKSFWGKRELDCQGPKHMSCM